MGSTVSQLRTNLLKYVKPQRDVRWTLSWSAICWHDFVLTALRVLPLPPTVSPSYLFLEILQNRISRKMNLILKVNVKFLLKVTTNVYSNVYHIKVDVNTKLYS